MDSPPPRGWPQPELTTDELREEVECDAERYRDLEIKTENDDEDDHGDGDGEGSRGHGRSEGTFGTLTRTLYFVLLFCVKLH